LFSNSFWDRIGILLSGLCALHCLVFPIAIALLPLWPVAESVHGWMHPILFFLIAPTVYFAVSTKNVPKLIPAFLFSGLTFIALVWVLHEWVGLWTESAITTFGSLLLIVGHWLNYRSHSVRGRSVLKGTNLK